MSTGTARAREELFAAHLLATTGFAAQAVVQAFRAALSSAEAGLLVLGRAPGPDQPPIIAAFLRHVVQERGLDPDAGRCLRSLHNRALQADADADVPQHEAPRAIADATTVVEVVAAWVEGSRRVADGRPHNGRPPSRRARPPR